MDSERIELECESVKKLLALAAQHKADGNDDKMRAEAKTAAALFVAVIDADDPLSLESRVREQLRSLGIDDDECDTLLTSQRRKARKTNKAASDGTSTPPLPAPQQVTVSHAGPHPSPKTLPAYPNAKIAKRKTPVQGGGHLRKRWKDHIKKRIYEWDSQHGELEEWDWSGKRHLGSSDPNGKKLKGPDSTKNPITPTISMNMDSNTTFGLYWFSAFDDELVGEVDLPEVTPGNVREWFFLSENEPLTDSFMVRASQRQHIARFVNEEIDLNKYDYFLECFFSER